MEKMNGWKIDHQWVHDLFNDIHSNYPYTYIVINYFICISRDIWNVWEETEIVQLKLFLLPKNPNEHLLIKIIYNWIQIQILVLYYILSI